MPRATSTGPICVVSLGFRLDFLLPMKKALQLVELLQGSVEVKHDYSARTHADVYTLGDTPEVSCKSVRADQIRKPVDAAKTLTHNPSESLL